jgi:hypothetical protein
VASAPIGNDQAVTRSRTDRVWSRPRRSEREGGRKGATRSLVESKRSEGCRGGTRSSGYATASTPCVERVGERGLSARETEHSGSAPYRRYSVPKVSCNQLDVERG